jgi:hyaluronoglucosaminidase
VHAPKYDPFHRERWRDPYPDSEAAQLAELATAARGHGVAFVYAIAPGLSINYSSDDELETLVAKCRQVRGLGADRVELLWDDVEHDLPQPGDLDRYGDAERPSDAAQADLSNRFLAAFPQDDALVVCPMGYAGTEETPYRRSFGGALDPSILVYWTGPEVVSQAIRRDDLDAAVHAFGHELVLWDNYPVNDFDRERLFLGPLRRRDPSLAGGRLAGIVANGMLQAVPSKLALATVADWARDPAAYEPLGSFERALRAHGAEVVEALARLAEPAHLDVPAGVDALVEAQAPGVDAATALALLLPFA